MHQKRHPHPGMFVALEGIDGAGKSWAIRELQSIAQNIDGQPPVVVREPGSTPFGEELREILTRHKGKISPVTEALAFNASRRELATQVIRPALMQGKTVITDRWTPSTRVYQSECPPHLLETVIKAGAAELVEPDLILLFVREPGDAVESKIHEYGEERRHAETARMTLLQNRYLELMDSAEPGRWIRCDFSLPGTSKELLRTIYRQAVRQRRSRGR